MALRILFITNYFPKPTGSNEAPFLYWRAKHLIEMGFSVSVVKWDQDMSDFFAKDYSLHDLENGKFEHDISVKRVNTLKLLNPFYKRRLYQWIKHNFDLVHFHWLWSMSIFPTIKKWGIPYVVTCHGSDINKMGSDFNSFYLGRLLNKWVIASQMKRLNNADFVTFVSSALCKKARNMGFFSTAFEVINNGYNSEIFFLDINYKQKRSIGFVGNLIPIKRLDKLAYILKLILDESSVDQVFIIGFGNLKKQFEKDLNDYAISDRVSLLGKLSQHEVADYMRKMKILLLPSRNEGYPCVVNEAQACGAMVVGSNVGGISEAIGRGGAVVVDGPEFEKRFAQRVIELFNNPIPQDQIKESILSKSWSKIVSKEAQIYHSILNKPL